MGHNATRDRLVVTITKHVRITPRDAYHRSDRRLRPLLRWFPPPGLDRVQSPRPGGGSMETKEFQRWTGARPAVCLWRGGRTAPAIAFRVRCGSRGRRTKPPALQVLCGNRADVGLREATPRVATGRNFRRLWAGMVHCEGARTDWQSNRCPGRPASSSLRPPNYRVLRRRSPQDQ